MNWPAVIYYKNCDEVEVVIDKNNWEEMAISLRDDCQLFFSDGRLFSVRCQSEHTASLHDTGETISVASAVELARQHMASQAHCCVSKFHASSVQEVVAALVALETD